MNIVTGQALILSLPFADGGESAYRRPFLVIETDPINNKVKVLNVSSVAGKEDKLLWPSNENIDNYNPPFTRPTYVKLDVIYELEYSSELDSSIGFGGTVLNAIELGNIASKLGVFCGSHRFKSTYYNFSQIKHKTS